MILADTSAWVEYDRATGSAVDRRLTELLTGLDATERMRLWETLSSMAWADIARSDWFVAGDLRAELRGRGIQVSLADVLIAGAAFKRATLWTRDRAFDEIAGILDGLDLRLLEG